MALTGAGSLPTLETFIRAQDPDNKIAANIIDVLKERNPILEDIQWMEGNMPQGHQTTTVAGYPTSMFRKFNQPVPVSHGETHQIMDTCGMIEAYSEVDVALANLNGNTMAFRYQQDYVHHQAMMNKVTDTLFHGSEISDPASFNGLGPRFADMSGSNSENILDAGGTGSDNTSIWLVAWGR